MESSEIDVKKQTTAGMIVARIATILIDIYAIILIIAFCALFYLAFTNQIGIEYSFPFFFNGAIYTLAYALCMAGIYLISIVNRKCLLQEYSNGAAILTIIAIMIGLYIAILIVYVAIYNFTEYAMWLQSLSYVSYDIENFVLGIVKFITFIMPSSNTNGYYDTLVLSSIVAICGVCLGIRCGIEYTKAIFKNEEATF